MSVPVSPRKCELFALKTDRGFQNIGTQTYVELHFSDDPIVPVVVEEKKGGGYWAWWDNKEQKFSAMWKTRGQVEMCFPYGPEKEIERGEGDVLEVACYPKTC